MLTPFWVGLISAIVLFDAYVGWDFYQRFKRADHGGFWHKAMDAAHDSLTILVTKLWLVLNTVLLLANPVAVFLAGPDATVFVQQFFGLDPQRLALFSLAMNAIIYFSRMRSIDAPAVPNVLAGG